MRLEKKNSEVLIARDSIVRLTANDLQSLKASAAQNERQRIRLCTHQDVNDKLHEMFIVLTKSTYIRPHKHLEKIESYHVIEGEADLVLFEDHGAIVDVIRLGDYASKKAFYFRVADPRHHMLIIRSGTFIFHETTTGPLNPAETLFPDWSPSLDDKIAGDQFVKTQTKAIDAFLARGHHG